MYCNDYPYTDVKDGTSQYADFDLESQTCVPAIYVKAKISTDQGNPYIEALPYPRSTEQIKRDYQRGLPWYGHRQVKGLTRMDKMNQVSTLRNLRFVLPFHEMLEESFYMALLTSYRARKTLSDQNTGADYVIENRSAETHSILTGDSSDATNAGFSLIGYSGCGKSSAVHTLVSYYPQVIMHEDGVGGSFPQITYLVVNCVTNSNFAALYQGIGDAIDKAFGNIVPVYAKEIDRIRTLGGKAEKVKEYVEKFAIGIIIFDEIQLIDFEHTRENTFDALLTLANRTKVAIAVVGTEDAKSKMFSQLRTARRVGNLINGNKYCENEKYFGFLVNLLFHYQWFDEPVEVTNEIVDALYQVTKGIVDQLIGVYSFMHYDYLSENRKKKPVIDANYIYQISAKYYPGIQDVLAELELVENSTKLLEIRKNAELQVDAFLSNEKQTAQMDQLINDSKAFAAETVLLENVSQNIMKCFVEFSYGQIETAFHHVMAKKSANQKSETEVTQLVIKQLMAAPKRKVQKSKMKAPDTITMKSFLGIGGEDDKNPCDRSPLAG